MGEFGALMCLIVMWFVLLDHVVDILFLQIGVKREIDELEF